MDFYKQNGSYFTTAGQKILNPTELQGYAKAGGKEVSTPVVPQGATKIADPSGLKGLTESQIFRQGQDIYKLPEVDKTVNPMVAKPEVPVVEPQSNTAPFMAILDTTNKGVEEAIKQSLIPPKEQAEAAETEKKIMELEEQKTAKPQDFQTEQEKYGFTPNVKALQDLNSQIASVQAQYNQLVEQNKNLPISSRIIGGTADRLQRQAAIELGGLSSMAQALQGNIEMAQNIAKQTVDMKYEAVQSQIDAQKFQLDSVYDRLDASEKRQADALNIALAERQRLLEDEKLQNQGIYDIMLIASQNGADNNTLQKIMKSSSPRQAILNAGSFMAIADNERYVKIGQDNQGGDIFYDNVNKKVVNSTQLLSNQLGDKGIVSASGNAYDMSTYATDPNHAKSIQSKLDEIGQFNSVEDIDYYIKNKKPNSPITGQDIANASAEYGVGWEELVALIEQESLLGTSNVAKSNNNLGGITWNANFPVSMKGTSRPGSEGGNYVKFATIQDGINSVAYELAKRKVDIVDDSSQEEKITEDGYDISKFTPEFYSTPYGQKVLNNEQQYNTNFLSQPIVKNYNDIQNKAASVQSIIESGVGGPGDLALVFEFMKSLDPTSVVRESEYESAAKSGNIFKGVYAKFNGYIKENGGFLPEEVKKSFLDITNKKLEISQRQYDNLVKQYRAKAYNQGLNPDNVVTELNVSNVEETAKTPEAQFLEEQGYISSVTPPVEQQQKSGSVWNSIRSWFGLPPQKSFSETIKEKVAKR